VRHVLKLKTNKKKQQIKQAKYYIIYIHKRISQYQLNLNIHTYLNVNTTQMFENVLRLWLWERVANYSWRMYFLFKITKTTTIEL